ncbi:MAG TPA: STAS domain-containing protein [Anaerolineae bacterium]|nr:STAS domain-containing protein [Anaerolineae bacterium]
MSENAIIVVKPQGRLDALGARTLWTELQPLTQRAAVRVLVDLGDTRYISSDGLRVLIRADKGVKHNGGKLVLCCLNERITEIVTMAGLDRVLEIHPTPAAAQRALDAHSSGAIKS